jgi:hypothetical protein
MAGDLRLRASRCHSIKVAGQRFRATFRIRTPATPPWERRLRLPSSCGCCCPAIPCELHSIHARACDGLDGRREIGRKPAAGGVDSAGAPRAAPVRPLPFRPDEGFNRSGLIRCLARGQPLFRGPQTGPRRLSGQARQTCPCERLLAVSDREVWHQLVAKAITPSGRRARGEMHAFGEEQGPHGFGRQTCSYL